MEVPVELPYYRDASELPGPLPSPEEIRDAPKSELYPGGSDWGDGSGVSLVRGIYIAKSGSSVMENEGNALLFIERYLEIPAPRLYAMYRDSDSGFLHLILEFLPGVNLESVWESLSNTCKSSIATQLRPIFARMRSLSPPPEFIGTVCGSGIPDPMFTTRSPHFSINGPFKNPEEVARALVLVVLDNWEYNGHRGFMAGFFARQLPAALKDYAVKFSHANLQMRSILVEKVPVGHDDGSEGAGVEAYRVSGIVG